MKTYAMALLRALLPCLRHALARVRSAALAALGAVVAVPDRAKCWGAGTAGLDELVGSRPDNVLPVAAFYRPKVDVNHLAEVSAKSWGGGLRILQTAVKTPSFHFPPNDSSCGTRKPRCAPSCSRCCATGCSACPTAAATTRAWSRTCSRS